MVCLISDQSLPFWTILILENSVQHSSDLLWFHVTEYFVQFHMVLWDFRQL